MSEEVKKARWLQVGTIMKSITGTGQYVKVKEDVALKKGQTLQVQNPRKRPGITDEQLARIPEYVLAELYLAPPKEE